MTVLASQAITPTIYIIQAFWAPELEAQADGANRLPNRPPPPHVAEERGYTAERRWRRSGCQRGR
eukprot:4842341-Pyramimonas_sp.AAC.1